MMPIAKVTLPPRRLIRNAALFVERVFMINGYRHAREGDGSVAVGDIMSATLITHDGNMPHGNDWLEIECRDHRPTLQTELFKNQPNVYELATKLHESGVVIERRDVRK